MSSTTEDSDWNMSPKSRRPHSLSNTVRSVPQSLTPGHFPPGPPPSSAPSGFPPRNSYAATNAQLVAPPILPSNAPAFTRPAANPAVSALSGIDGASHAALIQNTPEWEAARHSVLSQMVTSQDLDETPTAKVRGVRRGVKTGGRRGRGGARPKIKVEADDGIAEQMAASAGVKTETPTRAKNKGGRPRGSRASGTVNRGGKLRGSTTATTTAITTVTTTVNRGGRPRKSRAGGATASASKTATKRKRRNNDDSDSDGHNDTDVSEEFNLLAHTSSGRRITQAKTFTPINLDPPASSSRKAATSNVATAQGNTDTPTTTTTRKPRPTKRRKLGETAVCINCGRGHSPTSNQIVFCDGCNTPWHQYCHNRPITPSVILIEEKEWMCSGCSTAREEKSHIAGKVAAPAEMTLSEKRTYLQTLEKPELISLLMHASTLHDDLPIFLPPAPEIPTIVEPRPIHVPIQSGLDEEEYYEIYVEPEPLPYPKAGNGLVLPPEDNDLEFLIDEDVVTYSHSWRSTHGWEGPGAMNWGGVGGAGMGIGIGGAAGPISVGA